MSYWTNRQEQLKKAAEKDEAKLKKRLSDFYDKEFKWLKKEIAAYYQQYGEDNVIAYRNLLQSLSDEDRRLLMEKMDEFAVKYPQYANLMPIRESIYKLDRLQGLQYSIYMAQANIAGYTNEQIKKYETSLAQKGLNYAMETLGFGKNFYDLNSDVVKQFVDVAWSNGENFSTRIWNDTQKLAQYLNQDMAQGFARGDSYDRLVRNLRKRFDRVNRNDAYRLVYTEGTYVMAESTIQPFKDDFEQYRLSPVLDGRTCPICRGLREQVFLISERQPGVNFPPIHPWCRCSWEIVVDDWDKWIDDYTAKHGGEKANEIAFRIASPGSTKSFKRSLKSIQENKAGLDKRRSNILKHLPSEGDVYRLKKDSITERDLAYLSAAAKVEFALFRSKHEDILIRGNASACNITGDIADEILSKKYEWVAHTHVDRGTLAPSPDDKETLRMLGQEKSTIVGIDGSTVAFKNKVI